MGLTTQGILHVASFEDLEFVPNTTHCYIKPAGWASRVRKEGLHKVKAVSSEGMKRPPAAVGETIATELDRHAGLFRHFL